MFTFLKFKARIGFFALPSLSNQAGSPNPSYIIMCWPENCYSSLILCKCPAVHLALLKYLISYFQETGIFFFCLYLYFPLSLHVALNSHDQVCVYLHIWIPLPKDRQKHTYYSQTHLCILICYSKENHAPRKLWRRN